MIPVSILPWLILGWLASMAGVAVYADHHGHVTERNAIISQEAHDDALAEKIGKAATTSAAKEIMQLDIHHDTVIQPLQKEIREHVVYRDCVNTPAGMRLINSALTGPSGSAPVDGGQLPAADPAR